MKNIKYISLSFLVFLSLSVTAQSHDKSYKRVQRPKIEAQSVSFVNSLGIGYKNELVNYSDQLGRTLQVVAKQASPKMKDVVKFYDYDKVGRVPIDYLGYADPSTDGRYKSDYEANQENFYQSESSIAHTDRPYRKVIFEESPLSRVVESGAEGWYWQPENGNDQGHTNRLSYQLNAANTVLNFHVNELNGNLEFKNSKYVGAKQLYYVETTDENDKITGSYSNQAGQNIAKVSFGEGSNPDLYTYYVYDNFGRLCYVITPELSAIIKNLSSINMSWSDSRIKGLAYAFKYDDKGRVAKKLVPGADQIYFVYDNYNRIVLQQDGNLRNSSKWKFIKYDALSRPVMMGIKTISGTQTQESKQQDVDSYYNTNNRNFEYLKINGSGTIHYYTNSAYPSCTSSDVLIVNYYDNYQFDVSSDYNYAAHEGIEPIPEPKGFLTGTKIKVMDGGNDWLFNAYYYDKKYRLIQSYEQNILEGYDRMYHDFAFDGTLVRSTHDHMIHENTPDEKLRTETRTYSTDHAGRVLDMDYEFENIDVTLFSNNYNEIGRLIEKDIQVSSSENSVHALQSIDYKYNIRGWLTHINDYLLSGNNSYLQEEKSNPLEQVSGVVIDSLTYYVYEGESLPSMPESVGILLTDLKYLEITEVEDPNQSRMEDSGESQIIWVYEDQVDSVTFAQLENIVSSTFVFDMSDVSYTSSTSKDTIAIEVASAVIQNMISLGLTDTVLINMISDVTIYYYYQLSSWSVFAEGDGDVFGMDILYNEGFSSLGGDAQFNGLISGIKWRSRQDAGIRGYGFEYDEHYRFTAANYGDRQTGADIWSQNGHYDVNNITYDLNGNIKTLDRKGVTGYSNNEPQYGLIDDLSYTYYNLSNQIVNVNDQSGYVTQPKMDFDDRVNLSVEYTYDDNGNLKKDLNKNITNITYNHLNKAEEILFSDGKSLEFVYDALGRKLSFSVYNTTGSLINETTYTSNYIYKDGNLEYVLTEEGRLIPDGTDNFTSEYYLRDHLGNVRVIYGEDTDGDAEILEEHHYYPFGMTFADLDYYNTPKNPYLYQSKPLIDEYDLNWHDFDARMFDSQLGRWHVIDPVIQFASPYVGMGNNPVSLTDPDGRAVGGCGFFRRLFGLCYKNDVGDGDPSTNYTNNHGLGSGSSGGSYSGSTSGFWGYRDSGGGGLQLYRGGSSYGSGGLNKGGGYWRNRDGSIRSTEFPDYMLNLGTESITPTKALTIIEQIDALQSELSGYLEDINEGGNPTSRIEEAQTILIATKLALAKSTGISMREINKDVSLYPISSELFNKLVKLSNSEKYIFNWTNKSSITGTNAKQSVQIDNGPFALKYYETKNGESNAIGIIWNDPKLHFNEALLETIEFFGTILGREDDWLWDMHYINSKLFLLKYEK